MDASAMETAGAASSLVMVPTACASARLAFTGAERFTRNVSLGSTAVSPFTVTETVPLVAPAGMLRVPLAAT
jgi:hypothetical protein